MPAPYYISSKHPECDGGWAVVDSDYKIESCHKTKPAAVRAMVGLALGTRTAPGGTHPRDNQAQEAAAKSTYSPPSGVQSAAKRALKWISEGKAGSGFTSVGRRRASQLASGAAVSRDTVARMKSYFARHEVDRKATGFRSGEEGFPTPGRVAWDAWGGDAGRSWVNGINLDK